MDKSSFRWIALLVPLVAVSGHAQGNDRASALPQTGVLEHATPSRLPDSPHPHEDFVLPANQDAGKIPKPTVPLILGYEYTLPELIDVAEREHPETRIAWETARNAAVNTGIAKSSYLPIVTASALGGYLGLTGHATGLGVTVRNPGNEYGSVEAVSLEWLLFDFGGRRNVIGAARKLSESSNIAFTGTHQQIIYAVSIAYYAYLAAVERHQTAVEALANAKDVEAAADARYKQGEGTVIETAQARELTAQSQLSVVKTQGDQEEAYAALLAAMGVSPLERIRIAAIERHPLSAEDVAPVDQLVRDSLARRPDVLEAYSTVQASQASVSAAQARNRPKIFFAGTGAYVNGRLGITAIPSIGDQSYPLNVAGNQWNGTALMGISIPVFDAHQRANAIQQAKNNENKATDTLDQVRLNAIREIVSAQNALRTAVAAYDAAAVLKSSAQTSYDAALDSYKQGVGTVTTAVEAETRLFEAELAESDAYNSALSAAATLAFATGTLGTAPK